MDARIPALADQLLLIERGLRALDWWSEVPPSDAALASQEPFGVDTLAFEEWLQWIFLPRMKTVIQSGGPLPGRSGIRPMAEVAWRDRPLEVRALLEAIGQFDRLIAGADA